MSLDLSQVRIFRDCSEDDRAHLLMLAETCEIDSGVTLFAEGDLPEHLYLRLSGDCMLSRQAEPLGKLALHVIPDVIAVVGQVAHTQRAITLSACTFLRWQLDDLLNHPAFARAARQYLSERLLQSEARREALAAPFFTLPQSAQLPPGPFVFNNTTILFVFCDASLDGLRQQLPEGLTLFRRTGRKRDSMLLAVAHFRDSHSEHYPDHRFSYTETTCFVPVRHGARFGLYPAWIYPSTYEPILLGREIYGFPKQLGLTLLDSHAASLSLNQEAQFSVSWNSTQPATEPAIVGALADWIGVQSDLTAAAFRTGDTLLQAMGIPFYRRIAVFNHKRIPAATTTYDHLTYDVDHLTQAVFSVLRWQSIVRLPDIELAVHSRTFRDFQLDVRTAYHTVLDMRLSTGRVLRDYRPQKD